MSIEAHLAENAIMAYIDSHEVYYKGFEKFDNEMNREMAQTIKAGNMESLYDVIIAAFHFRP